MTTCLCKSNKSYQQCCGRFIENNQAPSTPEELMRSRYSAYTLARIDYIVATQIAPGFCYDDALEWAKKCKWLGLEVHRAWIDEKNPAIGFVEFTAHFKEQGRKKKIEELSRFELKGGKWVYVNG